MYIKRKVESKFIRFLITGVINTAFGYGLFALFIYMGIYYMLAVLLSTILGILFNFKTIGKIVFDSHDNSLIFRFFTVYTVIYLLNITSLWIMKFFGFENMYLNGFILLFPLAIVSFVLNKKFVFERG